MTYSMRTIPNTLYGRDERHLGVSGLVGMYMGEQDDHATVACDGEDADGC